MDGGAFRCCECAHCFCFYNTHGQMCFHYLCSKYRGESIVMSGKKQMCQPSGPIEYSAGLDPFLNDNSQNRMRQKQ